MEVITPENIRVLKLGLDAVELEMLVRGYELFK